MARRKANPGPWTMTWQTSPKGRMSRFEIKDANGKKIGRAYTKRAAALMGKAEEMYALLEKLSDLAACWRLILSREFEHDVAEFTGPCIEPARELLYSLSRYPWRA